MKTWVSSLFFSVLMMGFWLQASSEDCFVVSHENLVNYYQKHYFTNPLNVDQWVDDLILGKRNIEDFEALFAFKIRQEMLSSLIESYDFGSFLQEQFKSMPTEYDRAWGSFHNQYVPQDVFQTRDLDAVVRKALISFLKDLLASNHSYKGSCLRPVFSFIVEPVEENMMRISFCVGHRCQHSFSSCSNCDDPEIGIFGLGALVPFSLLR